MGARNEIWHNISDQIYFVCEPGLHIARLRKDHPHAAELFDRWQTWLDLPVDDLIARMLDLGLMARDMRQVTPFAGVLSARERLRVLKRFQKENAI